MKPIKIAFVIDYLTGGGTAAQLHLLLSGLDRNIFDPVVFCIKEGGKIADKIETLGISVELLPRYTFPAHPLGQRLRQTWQLAQILRKRQIEIVQNYLLTANIFGTLAAKLASVPHIFASERNVINTDAVDLPKRNRSFRFVSRWCDAVIGNSELVGHYLRDTARIDPAKIRVIQNGVRTDRFDGIQCDLRNELKLPGEVKLIGKIARLVPQKNHALLLTVVRQLAKKRQDFCLLLIGDGGLRSDLEQTVDQLEIGNFVRFLGNRQNVPSILATLDIVVQSSDFEGMPNAIMEALIAEKAVVATDAGGTGELIIDGQTGVLVSQGSARNLKEGISFLLDNPTLAQQLGQAGAKHVRANFSIRKMVALTQNLYFEKMGEVK